MKKKNSVKAGGDKKGADLKKSKIWCRKSAQENNKRPLKTVLLGEERFAVAERCNTVDFSDLLASIGVPIAIDLISKMFVKGLPCLY